MAEFTRTWFDCSNGILEEHSNVEIRQRYLYVITKDKQIVIVSKGKSPATAGQGWQFPGGHPNGNETWQETLVREVYEETGVRIENSLDLIKKIGYYLIEFPKEKFLQERYVLILDELAENLNLEPHEDPNDETPVIKFVKAVPISELSKYIPWTVEVEDWKRVLKLLMYND